MSEDIFVVVTEKGVLLAPSEWGQNADKNLTMHRRVPCNKDISSPKCQYFQG